MARTTSIRLPVLTLAVSEQRYSCHGCGNCCRDFTVQLREDDLRRLREQKWEERLGIPVTVEFRGQAYLRQRDDGGCVFWMPDGRCRIHAEFGFEEKPIACQLFPFSIVPGERDAVAGVNFACGSVLENKGAALGTHRTELLRMAERAPETVEPTAPIALAEGLVAEEGEIDALVRAIDSYLRRTDVPLVLRLDGLAWLAQSLMQAKLAGVRKDRFRELIETLVGALPDELAHLPIDAPGAGQRKLLRQAIFARTEDPKIRGMTEMGRWRTAFGQFLRSRRWARATGLVPRVGLGWPDGIGFGAVERVAPLGSSSELAAMDELLGRYMRASLHGRRVWGPGYYGWPVTLGMAAHVVNIACVGWLARLHAAGRGADVPGIVDLRAALSRVDRISGRAPWIGSAGERLRMRYLAMNDGLRRITAWNYFDGASASDVVTDEARA
ncbi:MAG: YkgJ family cysteine cluster protein [Phycisphaerae bacterium]|jgi:lysine-N-methylase|nr:YkgJ family cysteine cluster protein [Phycisphaerae bacterium]